MRLYNKYTIQKSDGTPTNPNAQYFVLRIDTDVHARRALRAYAKSIEGQNMDFARELRRWLLSTHNTEAGKQELDIITTEEK